MRKTFIAIALFAMIGTLAVSCQKENIMDQNAIVAENGTVYKVSYTVDGVTERLTIVGEAAWHDFLNRMMALAEEGREVTFRNEEAASQVVSTKKVTTFETKSRAEAYAWTEKMFNAGYTVAIFYDNENDKYVCFAIGK